MVLATRIVGLLLVILSTTLVTTAKNQLGDAWSIKPKATYLVTHGLYSVVRNPIYVFHVFTTIGCVLVIQWWWLWLVVPVEIVIQTARAHEEAIVLRRKFGNTYESYMRTTWF